MDQITPTYLQNIIVHMWMSSLAPLRSLLFVLLILHSLARAFGAICAIHHEHGCSALDQPNWLQAPVIRNENDVRKLWNQQEWILHSTTRSKSIRKLDNCRTYKLASLIALEIAYLKAPLHLT